MARVLTNQYFSMTVGGPQKYGPLFMSALRARGHEAVGLVLKPLPKEKNGPPHIQIHHEEWGEVFDVERFLGLNMMMKEAGDPFPEGIPEILDDITNIVSRVAPDCIVLSGFGVTNWYIAEAARRLGIPYILSHHGFWFQEIGNSPKDIQPRLLDMEREATERAVMNVYLNEWSRRVMHHQYPSTIREDDLVIPLPYNPIYLNPATPLPLVAPGKIVVGFIGRWDPIKNVVVVRELAERAKDVHIITAMRIGLRSELKEEEDLFKSVVDVRDPLPPEDLARLYQRCDLMILPSRFDVSPTVVMEAALQGKGTIISSNVGWVDLYERQHMHDWILQGVTSELLERSIRLCHGFTPPQDFLDEIRKNHHPDRVFDRWSALITDLGKGFVT